jgi:ATP-dependent Clp protease ATP-binding subunit ClpB
MNLNNFTIQASEVIQSAQQLAFNAQNPNIETEHILLALLEQKNSPVEYLLKKNNVSLQVLQSKLKEALLKLPKSEGSPAQALSREASNVLLKAGSLVSKFEDEFVTPEHLLLSLMSGADTVAKMIREAGATESGIQQAIRELRKGEKIKSQTQETQFNALEKYAKNLIEMARQGKLDPVIGRDQKNAAYPHKKIQKQSHTGRRAWSG